MFKLFGAPGVLLALVLASVKEPRRGRTEPGSSPPLRTPTYRTARTRSAGSSKGMSARRVVDLRRHAGGGSGSGSGGGGDDDSNDWAQRRADRDSTYVPPSLRPATPGEIARYWCSAKALLLLCVAGAVRNAGGYVWAYNTELFFENVRGETPSEIAVYMGWIPLLGGSLGAVVGGVISDKVVKRGTVSDRLWVLIISQVREPHQHCCVQWHLPYTPPSRAQLCAAPFSACALLLPVPWAYLSLIPGNIIGEMWVGVCLALVIDLVPANMRASCTWAWGVVACVVLHP